jgi:hypothetical protein
MWLLYKPMFQRNILPPDDGDDTYLQKCQFLQPHSLTSQKTAFFVVTALKTSNVIHFDPHKHPVYWLKSDLARN